MRRAGIALYVHLVWATWDRLPLLRGGVQRQVYRAIGAKTAPTGILPPSRPAPTPTPNTPTSISPRAGRGNRCANGGNPRRRVWWRHARRRGFNRLRGQGGSPLRLLDRPGLNPRTVDTAG
jgi:hypothetical protein